MTKLPHSISKTPALDALLGQWMLAPRYKQLLGYPIFILLKVYVMSLLRALPIRPLVMFVGSPGSAKTSLARIIGRLILGPSFEVGSVALLERDWIIGLAKQIYAVADNVETPPKWFAGATAKLATGGDWRFRRLYKDNEEIVIAPKVNLAITTATPSFLTGYQLDRSLIFHLSRPVQHVPESRLVQQLEATRAQIHVEMVQVWAQVEFWIGQQGLPIVDGGRMADFAAYAVLIAAAADGQEGVNAITFALRSLAFERVLLLEEHDEILGALLTWVARYPKRWITAGDLLGELAASTGGLSAFDFGRRDPARFGRWLAELKERVAGVLQWQTRTRNGYREYQFAYGMGFQPVPEEPNAGATNE